MKLRWYTVLTVGVVLVVYTVIGGVVFSALEYSREKELRDEIITEIKQFIDEGPCVNMTTLGQAYSLITDMTQSGLEITVDGSVEKKTHWDYRSSIFVSLQVIATLGFPQSAPRSGGGRAFMVFFTIFGIPLFLVTAIGLGQLLNRLAEWLRVFLLRTCRRPLVCGARTFRSLVILVVGFVLFIIIPSVIFKSIEPWTYGDAFYFSFITMSTIGFGDLVPSYNAVPWMSDNYRNWYRLAIAVWILLLSSWLAGMLVALQTSIATSALSSLDKIQQRAFSGAEEWGHDIRSNMRFGLRKDLKAQPRRSSHNQFIQQQQWHEDQMIYQPVSDVPNIQTQWTPPPPSHTQAGLTPGVLAAGPVTRLTV